MRKEPDRNSYGESNAKSQHQAGRRRQHIESGIGDEQRSPHPPGIVIRNVDQRGIYRGDQDLAVFRIYALLRSRGQTAGLLRLKSHGLDRVHEIAGLVVVRVTELLRPGIIARHVVEHGGKRGQRFDAGIPCHPVCDGGALIRRQAQILLRPSIRVGNLIRVGGCGQDLSHQRVRIQSDRRDQLIQLHGIEGNVGGRLTEQVHLGQRNHQYRQRHGQHLAHASVQGNWILGFHRLRSFHRSRFIVPSIVRMLRISV
jgi:hypothetical protein